MKYTYKVNLKKMDLLWKKHYTVSVVDKLCVYLLFYMDGYANAMNKYLVTFFYRR